MAEEVTVSFKTNVHRTFFAGGQTNGPMAEVDHPVFGVAGSKIYVRQSMIHDGDLATRLTELHDAVEIALSHLDNVAGTGDMLVDNERRAECASHAREVLMRVL